MFRTKLRKFITIFVCAGLIFGKITPTSAAVGDLDITFGTNGMVNTNIGASSEATSMVIQSDGKIVVAGLSVSDFAIARYNANGSPDTSFDSDGIVTTDFNGGDDKGLAIALQSDGKIVVAGDNDGDFAIARYNANGSLDTSFDSDGKVTTHFGGWDSGQAIVIQPNGKILVAGLSLVQVGRNSLIDIAIARYNLDGSLDVTFDSDGKLLTDIDMRDNAASIALQSNGKIVVGGSSSNGGPEHFIALRYDADGTLDTSFSSGGIFSIAMGDYDQSSSIAIQNDGKILIAGYASITNQEAFAIARLNADGSLDSTFGSEGKATTLFGPGGDGIGEIALQSDGKIVAAGYANNGTDYVFAVARYNSVGGLDSSFGTGGKLTTLIGISDDGANTVAIQADGKIIAAGYSDASNSYQFALARYLGSDSSATTPAVPTLNSVTGGDRSVSIFFTPGADNGATITDYEYSLNGGSHISAGTTSSPMTISGLTGRTSYSVTIKARNSAGLSAASSPLSATTTDSLLDANEAAAIAEAARVAAAQTEAAKKQKELLELLSIIPSLGSIALNLGETTKALTLQKCVKKTQVEYVKKGAKCPKRFIRKK